MAAQKGHKLDLNILEKYYALPQPTTSIQAEYIWIGGSGQDVRSKTRVCSSLFKFTRALIAYIPPLDNQFHS